jgi:hypothetical protein
MEHGHSSPGSPAQVQREPQARGCHTLYLTTFSFQAPAFYQALGYRPVAELRGFPDGIVKYLMVRTLPP